MFKISAEDEINTRHGKADLAYKIYIFLLQFNCGEKMNRNPRFSFKFLSTKKD